MINHTCGGDYVSRVGDVTLFSLTKECSESCSLISGNCFV